MRSLRQPSELIEPIVRPLPAHLRRSYEGVVARPRIRSTELRVSASYRSVVFFLVTGRLPRSRFVVSPRRLKPQKRSLIEKGLPQCAFAGFNRAQFDREHAQFPSTGIDTHPERQPA